MILVDKPGPDRVCGERRTTHRNIVMRLSLQVANGCASNSRSRRVFDVVTVSSDLE
jgi:hypothetical protein